jgi:hypothetical protein
MPYGGNYWLALTEESTLDPEIPICDLTIIFGTFALSASPTRGICCTSWPPT